MTEGRRGSGEFEAIIGEARGDAFWVKYSLKV